MKLRVGIIGVWWILMQGLFGCALGGRAEFVPLSAGERRHIRWVYSCLRSDMPIDAVDAMGNTLLHDAAGKGYATSAGLLIFNGAPINARNYRGCTPLHHAVLAGRRRLVDLLIANGGEVDIVDDGGHQMFEYVHWREDPAIERMLDLPATRPATYFIAVPRSCHD